MNDWKQRTAAEGIPVVVVAASERVRGGSGRWGARRQRWGRGPGQLERHRRCQHVRPDPGRKLPPGAAAATAGGSYRGCSGPRVRRPLAVRRRHALSAVAAIAGRGLGGGLLAAGLPGELVAVGPLSAVCDQFREGCDINHAAGAVMALSVPPAGHARVFRSSASYNYCSGYVRTSQRSSRVKVMSLLLVDCVVPMCILCTMLQLSPRGARRQHVLPLCRNRIRVQSNLETVRERLKEAVLSDM